MASLADTTPEPNDDKDDNEDLTLYRRTKREVHARDIVLQKSMLSQSDKAFGVLFSCIVVSMLSYTFPATIVAIPLGELRTLEIGLLIPTLGIIPLVFVLAALYSVYNFRYVIGAESLRCVEGLLAPRLRTLEVYYRNVRMIEVEQSAFQRLLNLGDIRVGPMLMEHGDVVLRGMRHPYQFKELIERRISSVTDHYLENT